jgi:LysR family glycine cleavage system transcriptional activator
LNFGRQTSNFIVQLRKFELNDFVRMPPLNSLRAFEAAQRHMSFQKAAGELHVTPAALSYQIRQLEEHLEIKLFNRLNRAVELTNAGRLLATGVEESFSVLRRSLTKLSRHKAGNVLVVSAGPAFTSKWFVPRLYRFLARHPNIDLRISSSLVKVDLAMGDVDVALRFGQGKYEGCTSVKLLDECLTPMCAPGLLKGNHPLKQPSDLAGRPLIHDETQIGQFQLLGWKEWLEAAGVSNEVNSVSGPKFDIADNAIDAAIAGAGIVLGRTVLANGDIEAGRLVALFDLKLKAGFAFYAVVAESRANEENIKRFVNWILDEVNGKIDTATPEPVV